MKIRDILGENFAGSFASVSFPMTPELRLKMPEKQLILGYITSKKKKQKEKKKTKTRWL